MKKFFVLLIALMLLVPIIAMAADSEYTVTFAWDDTNEKTEGYRWELFMTDTPGSYDLTTPATVIDYVDGQTVFESNSLLVITGLPGEIKTKYFVIRAVQNEIPSGLSNEVSYAFPIPMTAPFSLSIKVVTPKPVE